MWTSTTVAFVLAVAVVAVDLVALFLSGWISSHTTAAARLHGWADDAQALAKALLPQFLELGLLFLVIAGITLLFA